MQLVTRIGSIYLNHLASLRNILDLFDQFIGVNQEEEWTLYQQSQYHTQGETRTYTHTHTQ